MGDDIIDRTEFLSLIVESSDDAIFGKDLDGRILSWNRAAERIYGYTREEAVGKPVSMLAPADRKDEITGILLRIKRGEPIERLETVRLRKDGVKIDVSLTVSPVKDAKGGVIAASTIARDVTAQKRLEEKLRKTSIEIEDLYNSAPCGYHSLDKDGVFVRINGTELKWLGYTREEVIGRMKVTDVMDPECHEAYRRNFARFKETGYARDLQFVFVRKDGDKFPVLVSATAVKDDRGEFMMSRSVVYDMTERKKAEDELKRLLKEVTEANAKVKLLTGMLPICASCKKIRNDRGFWDSVEKYITEHSEAVFTHSLCPDCAKRLYPEFYDKMKYEGGH